MSNVKVTEETIKTVSQEITRGVPIKYAVVIGGISLGTHYKYYNKGKKAIEKGDYDEDSLEVKYFQAIDVAKAKAVALRVEQIRNAADEGTWTAAAWWLERVDHEHFGKKSVIDANVNADVKQTNIAELFNKAKVDEILKEE